MAGRRFQFRAELWEHEGDGAWHFLALPADDADEIDAMAVGARRGFGSVRVEVTVGESTWRTSVFPDKKRATYVLPVKRAVRDAEALAPGSMVDVELVLIDD